MDELNRESTNMATRLSLETLENLAGASRPSYERSGLKAGIVHFGVGNFHRAHQAVYLDALFNLGLDHDWAIIGAGVMPGDTAMMQALAPQDFLTTVVEQEADSSVARITGAMVGFVPPGDTAALITQLADPAIRIVSLTVTEGGYFIDPATGKFDPEHPSMVHDAANPAAPRTTFGLILAGLVLRRQRGIPPYTVMSCDNIPHNGNVTRNAVAGLAAGVSADLADWVRTGVAFPNGMVDRITPATGDRERALVRNQFGIEDAWPVCCEDFSQWVLEDNFSSGRPALEKVGVQFVSDVAPYEHMKIRILNGGHAIIAYPAGLLGITFVHEAMENPLVRAYLAKVERDEIIPTVPPVPATDLDDYAKLIVRRFSNPKIGDTIRRLCYDGGNRQPKFILPPARERLNGGQPAKGLALESALWCRYCFGMDETGAEIPANDPIWDRLQAIARQARTDPLAWLAMKDIYGDVADFGAFRADFSHALKMLWAHGTEETLKRYLANQL
jgi:mannitol 2-dehydrogenase